MDVSCCHPAHSQGGRRVHAVRSLLRPVTLPGPLALCPSPSSSHHHSRIPSLTPSIAVCALPRLLPSTCRCRPSMSAVVSIPSAVPLPSAVSTSAVRPRPFPLTYHIVVVPLTSLAHVASALIFCPSLAHHISVLILLSRRVAPRPSATVIIALLFVLALSALACASPSARIEKEAAAFRDVTYRGFYIRCCCETHSAKQDTFRVFVQNSHHT